MIRLHHSLLLPSALLLPVLAVGCEEEPADDDTALPDDDATDDDTTPSDDDVTADDDSTPADDDATPPDDDTAPDDDTTPSDDDSTPATCAGVAITLEAEWGDADFGPWAVEDDLWPGLGIGDLDGDGWLDVLVAWPVGSAVVLRNDGAGTLVEDVLAGLPSGNPLPPGRAVHLADLDGDGDLDAVMGHATEGPPTVLRNDGTGHFAAEVVAGPAEVALSESLADADGDGDLDLFEATFVWGADRDAIDAGNQTPDSNHYYVHGDAGTFEPRNDLLPAEALDGFSFQGIWYDHEGDGDLDLYVANDFGSEYRKNEVAGNDGTGQFTRVTDCGCRPEMHAMGGAVLDVDADGLADMVLTDTGPMNLSWNVGGGEYVNASLMFGLDSVRASTSYVSWGIVPVDIDQDGDQDLAVAMGENTNGYGPDGELPPQEDLLLLTSPGLPFVEATSAGWNDPSMTRSVVAGDIDRDGRPDLVTAGISFVKQWRTAGGCPPGITLRLRDDPLRRNAIGSRIEVEVGGESHTSWLLPSTTSSSTSFESHLGLGTAPAADRVTVTWPDGAVSTADAVPAGTVLELAHP